MKITNYGGLCNRLRIMLGYRAVCMRKGETLDFAWTPSRYANGHAGEFSIKGITLSNVQDGHVPIASSTMFQGIANTMLGGHDRAFEVEQWRSIDWSDQVREMAKQGATCGLAVHVRRTDHDGWHKLTTEDFVRRTAEVVRREGFRALPIYLATDGQDVFEAFAHEFGANNLRHIPKDYTLPYQLDLATACADIIACSQARFFIGTRNSSFTDAIRSLRGEPIDACMWGPDYGHARPAASKPQDAAVITCHFNWCDYQRPRANLMRFIRSQERDGNVVFGIEAYLKHQTPITTGIPGWSQIETSRRSIMFQKEALLNQVERSVPSQYTKLAWVDGDVHFDSPDWLKRTSEALEAHNVVQPYAEAVWTGSAGEVYRKLPSVGAYGKVSEVSGHPGFAMAARRDFWSVYGGLYPWAVTGRGDTIAAAAFLGLPLPDLARDSLGGNPRAFVNYKQWAEPIAAWTGGKMGHISGVLHHDYHGELAKRQYATRHACIEGLDTDRDLEMMDSGVLQWSDDADPAMMMQVHQYLLDRDEDG